MLNRKEDWQGAFGEPDQAFNERVQRTLNQLEEGKPMKKITIRMAAIAFALVLMTTGVVYAATNGWMIADYFNNRYGDNVNAPKDFDSGYSQDYTQELDGLTFHIRDAYVSGRLLNAIVEIARTDGAPALFRGEDCMMDDLIGNLYVEKLDDEVTTVEQYAKEKNLPVYWVETGFFTQSGPGDGSADYWMEEDKRLAYFISVDQVQTENNQVELDWRVYVHTEDPSKVDQQSMKITIPVEEQKEWQVAVNQRVEGLPVIVDRVCLIESRMGLMVDIDWHLDMEDKDHETIAAIQRGDINLWFELIDPATGKVLPGGPTTSGSFGSKDDMHYIQQGESVSADFTGDTLCLRAFDAWEKTRYGTVEVKIK